MNKVKIIIIKEEESNIRLDKWFKINFSSIPYTTLAILIRKGQIRVNGKRTKINNILISGQEIKIPPIHEKLEKKRKKIHISKKDKGLIKSIIIYEDEHLIVINKPAGIAVQGGSKTKKHIDNIISSIYEKERPLLVHRLDKDTSGILVVAKNKKSASWLSNAFKKRLIKKIYWAIVIGVPKNKTGKISLPLIKKLDKVEVNYKEGSPSITYYEVIDKIKNNVSWLSLQPITGRTHQIRIHCSSIGHPILGDKKYGGEKSQPFNKKLKIHLHSRTITITYPNGEEKTFSAPLPKHMKQTWDFFCFESKQLN